MGPHRFYCSCINHALCQWCSNEYGSFASFFIFVETEPLYNSVPWIYIRSKNITERLETSAKSWIVSFLFHLFANFKFIDENRLIMKRSANICTNVFFFVFFLIIFLCRFFLLWSSISLPKIFPISSLIYFDEIEKRYQNKSVRYYQYHDYDMKLLTSTSLSDINVMKLPWKEQNHSD